MKPQSFPTILAVLFLAVNAQEPTVPTHHDQSVSVDGLALPNDIPYDAILYSGENGAAYEILPVTAPKPEDLNGTKQEQHDGQPDPWLNAAPVSTSSSVPPPPGNLGIISKPQSTVIDVVELDGWQAYCGDYSPQMSLPSTQLFEHCLQACRTFPDCRYVTLDYFDNRCWFITAHNDCKFIRNSTRSTLADVTKNFVMQEETDYYGFDLKFGGAFAVPEQVVTMAECVNLCQIHPLCNVAGWDFHVLEDPRCYLKNVPHATSSRGSPLARMTSFVQMAKKPAVVSAADDMTGNVAAAGTAMTDDHSTTTPVPVPAASVHPVHGSLNKSPLVPSHVPIADGWQAYCDDPSPQLSIPSTDLAAVCLNACRTIPYCEYVTLDYSDNHCWFLSRFNQCKFIRSPSRATTANSSKELGILDDIDFEGYDILYHGSMIVPEKSVSLDDCAKLCRIHPFCTGVSWDYRAPDDPRCYLKQLPQDPTPWTYGTLKFGVTSLWVVSPAVTDDASATASETTQLEQDGVGS